LFKVSIDVKMSLKNIQREIPTVLFQIVYLIIIGLGIALILLRWFSVDITALITGVFFVIGIIFIAWYNSQKK